MGQQAALSSEAHRTSDQTASTNSNTEQLAKHC